MECLVIYGYHIKPERIAEFEVTYSVTGPWADLLRTMPGYLGTRLLLGVTATTQLLTAGLTRPLMSIFAVRTHMTIYTNAVLN